MFKMYKLEHFPLRKPVEKSIRLVWEESKQSKERIEIPSLTILIDFYIDDILANYCTDHSVILLGISSLIPIIDLDHFIT